MFLAIVIKLSTALLNILNSVETDLMNFGRKIAIDPASLNLSHKLTGNVELTDILLQ